VNKLDRILVNYISRTKPFKQIKHPWLDAEFDLQCLMYHSRVTCTPSLVGVDGTKHATRHVYDEGTILLTFHGCPDLQAGSQPGDVWQGPGLGSVLLPVPVNRESPLARLPQLGTPITGFAQRR
jgi:hypothetical protein